jgi:hypothetical protein
VIGGTCSAAAAVRNADAGEVLADGLGTAAAAAGHRKVAATATPASDMRNDRFIVLPLLLPDVHPQALNGSLAHCVFTFQRLVTASNVVNSARAV